MEASLYFSAFVLAMCALHMIWTASATLGAWWRSHVPPSIGRLAENSGRAPQRNDWYVFFHCADLVGKEPVSKKASPDIPDRVVTGRKNHRSPRVPAC